MGQPSAILVNQALALLSLAHLARCAAAILRRDDADIVRFGVATLALPLTLAQRRLCAAAIFALPAALIFRRLRLGLPPPYTFANAVSAAFKPDNCLSTRSTRKTLGRDRDLTANWGQASSMRSEKH
jgi:hypothetical protein